LSPICDAMRMRKKTDQKLLDSKVTFTVTMPFFPFLVQNVYSIRGGDDLFNTVSNLFTASRPCP
jgi:hypothetical protein